MKATLIIFILTSIIYIHGSSTFEVSYEHTGDKFTDIPSRLENNRIMNGTPTGNDEYAYVAEIWFPIPHRELYDLRCRGVLIAPQWVVTVANCFDKVLKTKKDRKKVSNFVWQIFPPIASLLRPYVRVAIMETHPLGSFVDFDKIYVPDRYDPRYDNANAVDVALIQLVERVPDHIASPPSRIDDRLLPDGSRMHPLGQDCWAVSERMDKEGYVDDSLHKMKVIVGNRQYCTALEVKLNPGKPKRTYDDGWYLCAKSDISVNPGARACQWDAGAALVCGNNLLGLLSRRHDVDYCEGENAYAEYVYLGHSYVYNWMWGTVNGTIEAEMYRSDESASGLVEASKTVTWLLTVISVAETLNIYY